VLRIMIGPAKLHGTPWPGQLNRSGEAVLFSCGLVLTFERSPHRVPGERRAFDPRRIVPDTGKDR